MTSVPTRTKMGSTPNNFMTPPCQKSPKPQARVSKKPKNSPRTSRKRCVIFYNSRLIIVWVAPETKWYSWVTLTNIWGPLGVKGRGGSLKSSVRTFSCDATGQQEPQVVIWDLPYIHLSYDRPTDYGDENHSPEWHAWIRERGLNQKLFDSGVFYTYQGHSTGNKTGWGYIAS